MAEMSGKMVHILHILPGRVKFYRLSLIHFTFVTIYCIRAF